jgi:formiminoglutamase
MTHGQVTDWERRYQPANRLMWRGRVDNPKIPSRFHEVTECVDLREDPQLEPGPNTYALIGFACDEGVRRNFGRTGAAKGPDACRQSLANAPIGDIDDLRLYDVGSVACWDGDLPGAQAALAHVVQLVLRKGVKPLVLGGGHETAWGHFQGMALAYPGERIGIINIDAHYDLRPLPDNGEGTSGTPFLQIAHLCHEENTPFDYTVIGIQKRSNTQLLTETACKLDVTTVYAQDLVADSSGTTAAVITQVLERNDKVYLTVCLDVFSAAHAPGVSAPQPLGVGPWQVMPVIQQVAASGKVIGFDICELAPQYDRDGATSLLAATLVSTYIHG